MLGLRSRGSTYTLVIGVVIGMLAAGLGIPFVFGEPLERTTVATRTSRPSPLDRSEGTEDGTLAGGGNLDGSAVTGTTVRPTIPRTGGGGPAPAAGPATGTGGAAPGVVLTASDRGVTPDAISLAFLLVDLGGVSQFGFTVPGFDPEEQQAYIQAQVDHVNAGGGVHGRRIDPKFFSYDPTDASSGQAACRAATQDNEIFAAVDTGSSLDFPGQLCFTEQHATPLVEFGGFGTTDEMYAKSAGRLVTIMQGGVRSLANTAEELVRQGRLEGTRIGIVDRDFPGTVQTVTDGMVATLERHGHEVVFRADLSMDNGTAASQVPVAVQQMRANQVDTVMLLTDFIIGTEFVQAADRSGYNPQYFVSDFESMTNDIAVFAMPESFRAVGITSLRTGEWRVNMPEPAVDAACRQTYARASGIDPKRSEDAYGGALHACGMVDVFVRGALAAGPELTRDRWVAGVQQIGAIEYPFFGGMSYGPGKVDGADAIRTVEFEPACPVDESGGGGTERCWVPVSDFRPPHF